MSRLLGIDIGTSGCRAAVVNESGAVIAQAFERYEVSMPQPLWSEQDPADWWRAAKKCMEGVRGAMDVTVDAIGLTGQMHGAVFLDGNDQVIRPAILWNDQRTQAECEEIDRIIGHERVRQITCNPPLTGFQLPKILWLKKHEPENWAKVRKILLPKDYVRFLLTGEHATDVTDASGTGIFDVPNRRWSSEMMEALHLDASLFPACMESTEWTGSTTDGIPVLGGAGDQAAGAVGTGTVKPGIVSVSLGTSGVVFACLDEPKTDPYGALHTFCHANGKWHAMGVMLSCGGAANWYAGLRGCSVAQVLQEAERAAERGAGDVTFLPYLSGERSPHNDSNARAAWANLNLSHGTDELSLSVLQGVTFGLRDSLDCLEKLGAECNEARVTGGGARSPFWVQLIADVFGRPFSTLETDEGPAFGAALIAGVGAGVWNNVNAACQSCVRQRDLRHPSGRDYSEAYQRFRSLYPPLKAWRNLSPTH